MSSESDDNIYSIEIPIIPIKENREKSKIEMALKDISLIESSDIYCDTNTRTSAYQSTIASSNQDQLFLDDSKFSHSVYNPILQSSVLENSEHNILGNLSNAQKKIDVITLDDDSPKISKVFSVQHHQSIIDLTENEYKMSPVVLKCDSFDQSKQLITNDLQYMKMEKIKLEDIRRRFTKNIYNLKVSI